MSMQTLGRIITFYSYKGGTGRSMAAANAAWLLASRGFRVLAIDWDLEAPGLHRYFEPFIDDPLLEKSTGIIDFALDFASAAVTHAKEDLAPDWHVSYANIRAHAIPVKWEFPEGGLLHLVPAGRQDSGYALRVNRFDWSQFYERLGGGIWLEAVKRQMRESYDYILVDSRTGVSDTSGICTVQMPDDLVVCFTLNNQSMRGASAVAGSALQQRRPQNGPSTLQVWPLPMRVEFAEQERLQAARALARTRFGGLMEHLGIEQQDGYWGEVEIAYFPFYAYEEVLAAFGDRPRQPRGLLTSMDSLLSWLAPDAGSGIPMQEDVRAAGWQRFIARPASDALEDLKLMCQEYSRIRDGLLPGSERTYMLSSLVDRASSITGQEGIAQVAESLFTADGPGGRVLGLALARRDVRRSQTDMVLSGVGESRSAFEQYYALLLASKLQSQMDSQTRRRLREAIQRQIELKNLTANDKSRWGPACGLLETLSSSDDEGRGPVHEMTPVSARYGGITCVDIQPPSQQLRYEDPEERHGSWVASLMTHSVRLPKAYRLGINLVTNAEFQRFLDDGGYQREEFWPARALKRSRPLVSADGKTPGPAGWLRGHFPEDQPDYPVSGICYYEAFAFVAWLQNDSAVPGWRWTLPREGEWEFAARTEAGFIYPWGDSFDPFKCNSAESGLGKTSSVDQFAAGASRHGCRDMAGNVWELLLKDSPREEFCVLRGGSFKNDRSQVRTYLRLFGVRPDHRPSDFGFRVAMKTVADTDNI